MKGGEGEIGNVNSAIQTSSRKQAKVRKTNNSL